jgi:hypothetical protein
MLWNSSVLKGFTIAASDGHIGTVSDFLFDDANWRIRWLVVDTGTWLSGRKVLLAPSMLGQLETTGRSFSVELTMQQVKDSPATDADLPVSRQMESSINDYYGWSPYWGNGLFTDSYGYVGATWTETAGQVSAPVNKNLAGNPQSACTQQSDSDTHLRSINAVTGYHIHASDGEIGHIEGFLLKDADWSIHYIIVDTKNWWLGKKVLISPRSVRGIDLTSQLVNLNVDHQTVKDSPPYDSSTIIDAAYDDAFLAYYGLRLIAS